MKDTKTPLLLFTVLLLSVFFNACRPVRNFFSKPTPYSGSNNFTNKLPAYDPAKKTVFIVADNKLTELFDMLTPFYLFNATQKANVYIVAKANIPILIKKDLYVVPQLTFNQADAMPLQADVIVIPALSIRDEHQDTTVINFIKRHFTPGTKMLAICDGASTAAATGLYDGKLITCHASDFAGIKKHFGKPVWVQNMPVVKSGNLFSTAGVSNAVDGSLAVINELFGHETMLKMLNEVNYPFPETRSSHQSIALSGNNKFTAAKKIFFRKNRDIGLLLENNINEFEMAALLDTYARSLPASFKTFVLHDSTVQTKYGLTLVATGNKSVKGLDELHVLTPDLFSIEAALRFKNTRIIRYDKMQQQYLVDICLQRIGVLYGEKFKQFVKITLDYN
ncbi:type 1 glutamine amidotransferase family protein [Ferruginibacter profundus]